MDTIKWLAQQAAIHKHQAKKVRNKDKRKAHKVKAECYRIALIGMKSLTTRPLPLKGEG